MEEHKHDSHCEHVPADCPAPWDHWRDGHWCNLAGEMN